MARQQKLGPLPQGGQRQRDARLDGKFVLTPNPDLPPAEVAPAYKSLWQAERTFPEQKSTLYGEIFLTRIYN